VLVLLKNNNKIKENNVMRKKKDKHEEPIFSKTNAKRNNKSKSQHSILHRHEQRLNEFKRKDERIATLNNKIRNVKKEMKTLPSTEFNRLEEDLRELEISKSEIESGQDEIQYLLDSSRIIMEYANIEEQEQKLLNNPQNSSVELNELSSKKASLVHEYRLQFEPNYVNFRAISLINNLSCTVCNNTLESCEGFLVCHSCGMCYNYLENSNDISFKEMQDYDYRPQFTYEKQSHLEDWLRRFQSKENRSIPQMILDKVILEAKKERMTDLNMLTEEKVKRYLKKLSLNEYYDNVIGIINRINGRPPFTLTSEIEGKIKHMFQQIQQPFEKYKPPSRRNFLSYSYCLHKFFQILGLHEFAKYFPLLKSADKLRQQDDIFKKIVAEMAQKDNSVNWVFYPSI
jgi:hypothetical protein